MRIDFRLALLGAALLATGCEKKAGQAPVPTQGAGPVTAAPTEGGWLETVSATPEGGFVLGNPAAKVKIVEFSSMTCPHCADFAVNHLPELKAKYIVPGDVSLEVRNFIRDPIDVTASLVARCGGAQSFYKMTEQMFADQRTWIEKYQTLAQADQTKIGQLPENQQYAALAKAGGLDEFAMQRGLPAERVNACLMDLKARDQLVAMNKAASDNYKLSGTPSFLINGEMVDNAFDWASLEPRLKAALGK